MGAGETLPIHLDPLCLETVPITQHQPLEPLVLEQALLQTTRQPLEHLLLVPLRLDPQAIKILELFPVLPLAETQTAIVIVAAVVVEEEERFQHLQTLVVPTTINHRFLQQLQTLGLDQAKIIQAHLCQRQQQAGLGNLDLGRPPLVKLRLASLRLVNLLLLLLHRPHLALVLLKLQFSRRFQILIHFLH